MSLCPSLREKQMNNQNGNIPKSRVGVNNGVVLLQ